MGAASCASGRAFGWCLGKITRPNDVTNDDARRSIDGSKVNFFAQYDGEQEEVPHVLEAQQYHTECGAAYDAWLLLESVEPAGAEPMEVSSS